MAGKGETPTLSLMDPVISDLDQGWIPFHRLYTVERPSRRVADSCGGWVLLVLSSMVDLYYVQV